MKFMLPRSHRLTRKKDFQEIYREGRSLGGRFISVKFKPNQLDHLRVGIVISKKVAGRAVDRSRAKRQLRQIVRPETMENNIGFDLALVIRRLPEDDPYQKLKAEWQNIWSEFKALCH